MSRRLSRLSLALVLLISSEVWALGLGDIRLESALNEPLRAEIELLSATPEELSNLVVDLASADTFARYGLDRPYYLQGIEFNVVANGPNGPVVQLRSRSPMSEPFLTFLVEATWASGRLLREYTVLLDPPTYAPPAVQQAPAAEAPRRAAPADSAPIERPAPATQPATQPATEPAPRPAPRPQPAAPATEPADSSYSQSEPASEPEPSYTAPEPTAAPEPTYDDRPYDSAPGADYVVQRGETLWSIATRMRPDSRLSINQTMLAIYEANPAAFGGNINVMRAGGALRIPSADDVFRISRGDALAEVRRQHSAWGGTPGVSPTTGYAPDAVETRPSLTLVPPDEEPAGTAYDDEIGLPPSREEEIVERIAELEAADVPDQQSLIEIRDNELASLRKELAEIRGEIYEPPVESGAVEEPFADEAAAETDVAADEIMAEEGTDEPVAEDTAEPAGEEAAEPAPATTPRTIVRTPQEPGIVDRIIGILTSIWTRIIAALLVVAGLLLWFVRRGREGAGDSGPFGDLDADDLAPGSMTATERISAPRRDEDTILVEEADSGIRTMADETVEVATTMIEASGTFDSLEDTFSSDTAVNLDQADPLAEADFHMAYGLYDQAAELINGALESNPGDRALMSKLCEIYFVWGNRDAFVDAATRLRGSIGDDDSGDWDKIVIMGQQIAADNELFAGAGVAGATRAVDLSFDADSDEAAALDMDFGGEEDAGQDVIDLGADEVTQAADTGVDFLFDEAEDVGDDATGESPAFEAPTIEQQFAGMDGTSSLPSLDEELEQVAESADADIDATAEIDLDDLGLEITGTNEALEDTGINEALGDPEIDIDVTSTQAALDEGLTGLGDDLDLDDIETTGFHLAADETGQVPRLVEEDDPADAGIDPNLLDATGRTQVLSEDMAVETLSGLDDLSDDEATMLAPADDEPTEVSSEAETLLAPLDDDEDEDFDFAKTEALPPEVFTGGAALEETSEMPAVAETDLDLDLDDLTAALQVSEVGDTIEQSRDDATVEQLRPSMDDETAEVQTMSLSPDDLSDDLHEARTMTEVGTKLDLARAYVDMGDPAGARSILEEVLDEGDEGQRQQAQQLLDSLPG